MKRIWVFLLLGSTALADVPVPPAASQTEVNAGVIHSKYVAPDTLHGYTGDPGMRVLVTATNLYAITPNTNVILLFNDSSALNVPAQGMCNDLLCGGTNTYIVDTSTILLADQRFFRRGSSPYAVVLNQNQATNQLAGWNYLDTDIHFGDPDLFSNYMYLPFENFYSDYDPPNGWINTYIGILNCHGPAGVIGQSLYKAFSVSNYQAEISSIAIDPSFSNGIALFASNWGAKHTTSQIYRYSLDATMTNLTFVNYMTLSQSLPYIQGMVYYNGLLYVMCDWSNTVYAVNPSNGNVVASIAMNVPVVGGSEFEGLDIYPTATGPLLAVEIVTTPATSQNGVNCFNFFGNPTVTSDQIVTGDLIGNLSLTTGKIGPDQLPYPLYLTGDPTLGVVDFHGVRFLYASYFLGNGLYLTGLSAANLAAGYTSTSNNWVGTFTGNLTIQGPMTNYLGYGITNIIRPGVKGNAWTNVIQTASGEVLAFSMDTNGSFGNINCASMSSASNVNGYTVLAATHRNSGNGAFAVGSATTPSIQVLSTNVYVQGTFTISNGIASYINHTPVAVTVDASPFSYTNNTPSAQEVHVGGGTITTISKMGVTLPDNVVNTLQPTNYIVITYTLAPTMTTNAW